MHQTGLNYDETNFLALIIVLLIGYGVIWLFQRSGKKTRQLMGKDISQEYEKPLIEDRIL